MTSTIDTPPPASAPADQVAPKPNSFQRIVGVIMAPNETFQSIAQRPDWVVPLILWLLIGLAVGATMAQKVDFAAQAREAIAQQKDLPPDAAERAVKFSAAAGKVSSYAVPVFSAIIYGVVAGIFLLAFRLFGAQGTYSQAFSTTLYAWTPSVMQAIVLMIVIWARPGNFDAMTMQSAVRSNLAFLVDLNTHPVLFSLLASVDVFRIWTVILLVIGFAAVGRVSKAKSASIVVSLWIVGVLFSLIPAAIRAAR